MKASSETTRIGFIGLGPMGKAMAGHLIAAGYRLAVHDSSLAAVRELVGKGAANGGTPAGVGRVSHIVITMLQGAPAVEHVLFGPDGVHVGLPAGGILIDMSTISPAAVMADRTYVWVTVRDGVETPMPSNDTTGPVQPIQFERADSIAERPPKTVQPADCRYFLGPPYWRVHCVHARDGGGEDEEGVQEAGPEETWIAASHHPPDLQRQRQRQQ